MPLPRIAHPFRRRLPATLAAADWRRIAAAPSYRGPRPQDVLDPPPFTPPQPPPLSAEERRLLDAVLADPDADEPRLRYADWCDRQGDPARGAFIREQLTGRTAGVSRLVARGAGHTPGHGTGPPPAAHQPADAGRSPNPDWVAPFAPWSAADFAFVRGFVEFLSLSGRAFITLGEPLFRMTPLRGGRLVAVGWYMDELARTPHLARLERLDLSGNHVGPAGVAALAGSPYLGRLTGLGLSDNALGSAGVRELLRAPWRGQLRSLALAGNELGREAVGDLLADPALAGLVELDLAGNDLGPDLPPRWPNLERLSLARNPIGPGVAGLRLGRLRALDLRFCRLGPAGAAALAAGPPGALEDLDLGFNDSEDAGAAALAGSAILSRVQRLSLRGNRVGPTGATALAASGHAGSVTDLDLMTNRLGDDGAAAVLDGFPGLERLDLGNNGITAAGAGRLAAAGALGRLVSLSLAWNPVGDAGAAALARCPDLRGLRDLDLTGTRIGFAGARALAESPHLANLRRLAVGENDRLPADAVRMLRDRFGTTV